ncbi:MAG: helix-turn-helix domain-containing protein [Methylovirgula sp.]
MSTKIVDAGDYFSYLSGMSPEQCRAARAWLGLSQDDLASAARVGNSTIRDFEAGRREPISNNLAAIQAALEARGIAFVGGVDNEPSGITFQSRAARKQ